MFAKRWVQLPETSQGFSFHDNRGGTAWMQTIVVHQTTIHALKSQGGKETREEPTCFVVTQRRRFTTVEPPGEPSLTTDHTTEAGCLANPAGIGEEHVADLKQPTTGLGRLQIALADFQMLLPEGRTQVTCFGEEGVADGNPGLICVIRSSQRERCDLLKAERTQTLTQATFSLLT